MLRLALVNFLFFSIIFLLIWLARILANINILLSIVFNILGAGFLLGVIMLVSVYVNRIIYRKDMGFLAELRQNYKSILRAGILILLSYILILGIAIFSMRYYFAMQNTIGMILGVLLLWITFFIVTSTQYIIPIINQLNTEYKLVIKKSILLSLDNPLLTIGILLGTLFLLLLSLLPIVSGIASVFLWQGSALKLLLYKYEYLEEEPRKSRRNIPWFSLLHEEREELGVRTLKGTIFPWKE